MPIPGKTVREIPSFPMIDHAIRIIFCAFGAWLIGWYMGLPWHGMLFTFAVLWVFTLIMNEMLSKWWWT